MLRLHRSADGHLKALSVEYHGFQQIVRRVFREEPLAERVLAPDFFEELSHLLDSCDLQQRVVVLPDADIFLPGIALSRLRFFIARRDIGCHEIAIRAGQVVGNLDAILRRDDTLDRALTLPDAMALDLLNEVARPMHHLATYSKLSTRGEADRCADLLYDRMQEIAARNEDLMSYMLMIERYLSYLKTNAFLAHDEGYFVPKPPLHTALEYTELPARDRQGDDRVSDRVCVNQR